MPWYNYKTGYSSHLHLCPLQAQSSSASMTGHKGFKPTQPSHSMFKSQTSFQPKFLTTKMTYCSL